ncbi:hypothetical protein [Microlunatus antarcticus]|uniref:PH domain-containing protein n=1 Tax=Microlunatus antarcticus TaxID=53388 RepID=A0A7W5JZ42_9ACTN|nr:hypothetical protein [Microlunatus antarcticus]MBB3328993.1 hypothetical protein [Microlunatus antarcticus]
MSFASVAPGPAGPVPVGPIAELLLPYDPQTLAQTVGKRRRRLIGRLISLAISLAILGGIYAWQHRTIAEQGGAYWVFSGIVLGLTLVWTLVVLLGFLRARKELRTVPAGIAVRMGRPGVVVANAFARWTDVEGLEVVPGGIARADRLRLRTRAGAVGLVPLDQVVVHPATLDGTARAYSAGRQGVDLSRLDN